MAKKRVIRIEEEENAQEKTEEVKEPEMPWSLWIKKTYLKYWYAVGCMFLDSFLVLEIIRIYGAGATAPLIAFVIVLLILGEAFLYSKIWKRESNRSGKIE